MALGHRIEIPSATGQALAADLYGTGGHTVVILAHGGYSSLGSWETAARALQRSGFRVLVVEARAGVDLAAGNETPCLYDATCLARDVIAGVQHARQSGATRISLLAGSMGGAAVAEAASDSSAGEVGSIVLLAPAAISEPERITGRKLFIVARDDANSAGLRLPGIRAQYERVREPKQFILLEGSAHAQRVLDGPSGEAVLREIVAFLSAPRSAQEPSRHLF